MKLIGNCCFFAHQSRDTLLQEQYTLSDIKILRELGFNVTISTSFKEVPYNSDLYFSWWASGSILPFIKACISRKPIIVVAGGHESMLIIDSVSKKPYGYLATPWYKKIATLICLRYCSKILVVSRHMIKDVKSLGAHAPIVVYNCIDTEAFTLTSLHRTFVTIMFNTKVYEHAVSMKRAEVFIRSVPFVLEKFPKQKFLVIGEKGNAYLRIQQLVESLGVEKSIEFIGVVSNSKIPELLNRSLVYVQISESETFGVAIAESMACGTPVVVSKKGSIPEIVGDCGVYVDNNNPKSVAFGIIELLQKSKEEREKIGLRARKRVVGKFSYARRKKAIQQVIMNLGIKC